MSPCIACPAAAALLLTQLPASAGMGNPRKRHFGRHQRFPAGDAPWPKRLRIHKIGEVYSLTWSFSSPDGRALFTIGSDAGGEPLLTWLAIGYHDIYQ